VPVIGFDGGKGEGSTYSKKTRRKEKQDVNKRQNRRLEEYIHGITKSRTGLPRKQKKNLLAENKGNTFLDRRGGKDVLIAGKRGRGG